MSVDPVSTAELDGRRVRRGTIRSRRDGAPEPLDLDRFVPFFIGAISNKWTASSSRFYLKSFGIGMTEWRILGSLGSVASTGSASSSEIAAMLGLDAAAVSRAVGNLEHLKLVAPVKGTYRGRTKPFTMTKKGASLFAAIRETALEREEVLLQDLDERDRERLLDALRKIHDRLPELRALENGELEQAEPKKSRR